MQKKPGLGVIVEILSGRRIGKVCMAGGGGVDVVESLGERRNTRSITSFRSKAHSVCSSSHSGSTVYVELHMPHRRTFLNITFSFL